MPSVALRISEEFKGKIERLSWVNWSELAREEALRQDRASGLFSELDELTKDSKLTDEDCVELGRSIKKAIWKRLGK